MWYGVDCDPMATTVQRGITVKHHRTFEQLRGEYEGELVPLIRDLLRAYNELAGMMHSGEGSPEGVVEGAPGDLYVSTLGGTGATLYVQENTESSTTGWVAK